MSGLFVLFCFVFLAFYVQMVSEDVDLKSALLVEIKPPLAAVAIGVK